MFINPIINLITSFTTVAMLYFGAIQVSIGALQVGQLIAVVQYVTMILMSIIMMVMIFIMGPRAITSLKRIVEVINASNYVKEGNNKLNNFNNALTFNNVSFSYPKSNQPVLRNINLNIPKGKITAIIGSTGSGKSSIINLLMRFYEYTEGSIMVDNQELRDLTNSSLRNIFGYVPQRPQLYSGTIKSNLALSGVDENISLDQALHIAAAKDFSYEKGGLEANVDQAGVNFSGGQKQRLSIARAIAKDPQIFIFDDSFSALDFKTESTIFNNLKTELKSKTIIIVAQRISSIKSADQIIVLDKGQVVGSGTHEKLLQTNSVYQEIVSSQASKGAN
jgi:ATP-binding cassette subfamily B protein